MIIENGLITNIIVSDKLFADQVGAVPYYSGAKIGGIYNPPTIDKLAGEMQLAQQSITNQELNNIETNQRITDLELVILGGGDGV